MTARPDLIECWVFRVRGDGSLEFLMIHRAPDRIFPGIWQCVTGGLDADETVPAAAFREVEEETGLGAAVIEAAYDLDQVSHFYDEGPDAIVSSVIFAVRVAPDAVPTLSHEHDAWRWVEADEARTLSIWPAYGESIRRIEAIAGDEDVGRWFALDAGGRRIAR